ncbi:flagellin [Luminiphilus sp.]|nr:flagellin [Luminiphilus sp.]
MPLSINTNIASLTAQRAMYNSNSALETSYERLSTGKRINSAVDDAAGLAIGKDLESRVSGLNQAIRNVNDGISMVQIAEGTLDEVTSILQRMRDLSVQAANGSLSSTEQGYLDTEASKLATTIGSVIDLSEFNGTDLVSNTANTAITLQSGADSGETTAVSFSAMTETLLKVNDAMIDLDGTTSTTEQISFGDYNNDVTDGTEDGVYTVVVGGVTYTTATIEEGTTTAEMVTKLSTATDNQGNLITTVGSFSDESDDLTFTFTRAGDQDNTFSISGTHTAFVNTTAEAAKAVTRVGASQASDAILVIDDALAFVASERASLGATQAQLESTVRNLANVAENTSAAAGRIMDTDYAAETANLTKAQILQQAATSVLAQANAQPQAVLSLLQ